MQRKSMDAKKTAAGKNLKLRRSMKRMEDFVNQAHAPELKRAAKVHVENRVREATAEDAKKYAPKKRK